jgi:hypothetical protein
MEWQKRVRRKLPVGNDMFEGLGNHLLESASEMLVD